MASEKKIDCVILGLLSHEPLTGYEIKKRMDTALYYFWNASYGSIYPALADLTEQGFATRQSHCSGGRNKQTYTITETGRAYLQQWLRQPAQRDEQRLETLLKLFFGNQGGSAQALRHVEAFEEKVRGELPQLYEFQKALESAQDPDGTHAYYLLTVKFGIETYEAYLRWCADAQKLLEDI